MAARSAEKFIPRPSPAPDRSPRDTAIYIQHMAKELRTLAAGEQLGFVAYLLGMVENESAATADRLTKEAADED